MNILLVEDNEADVRLLRESLLESELDYRLEVVDNGVEALRYLRQINSYTSAAKPDIILLDLNLPLKDGREVLKEIKSDPVLKAIPVIVLTTSMAPEDIEVSYNSMANCYITKPVDYDGFMEVVRGIERFWMRTVSLPSANGGGTEKGKRG